MPCLRCVADVNGLERDVHLVCHMVRQVELVSRIAHGKLVDFADVNTKRHSRRYDLERCVLRLVVKERTRCRCLVDIVVTRIWIGTLGVLLQPYTGRERRPQPAMVSSFFLAQPVPFKAKGSALLRNVQGGDGNTPIEHHLAEQVVMSDGLCEAALDNTSQ